MEEVWKDVKGFKGRYQVSNMGRVKSLARMVTHRNKAGGFTDRSISERIISTSKTKEGYFIISLNKDGRQHYYSLHRIVALHFCEGYKPGLVVNHKNEIKTDNRAENLEWCTQYYNKYYGTGIERAARSQWKAVAQYDANGNLIATYQSGREASEKTGFPYSCISAWCLGAHQCKAGYIWKFL